VEDSGEGIPPEVLARVMEPFFTTKAVGKGTGLGLSMTHGVIKAHGGTLEIASIPGRGTTVRLRLPLIPAPPVEQPALDSAPALGQLKVLLVDDDEDVRFLVTRMLKAADLQVQAVAGGEEALASLQSGAVPDLIILDQNMPRMNGIQTMEKVRALYPEVPILISSGQPDIEEWACFKQANVAVIPKPFEMEELLAKLARISLKARPSPDS
jgi:CheY-like chemotaxis protein